MYQLHKAVMIYGIAEYPLHGLNSKNVPSTVDGPDDIDLDKVARELHRMNPALSVADYRSRAKLGSLPAFPDFGLPAMVQVYGSGFRFVWHRQ